jgi:hypothetical protein
MRWRRLTVLASYRRTGNRGMAAAPGRGSVHRMSWDELLALLMGWAGRRVLVTIATGGDMPVSVAAMEGVLAAGELLEEGADAGVMVFRLAGVPAAFMVMPAVYGGAGFSAQRRSTLVVRLGPLRLWIEPGVD